LTEPASRNENKNEQLGTEGSEIVRLGVRLMCVLMKVWVSMSISMKRAIIAAVVASDGLKAN